MSGGQDSRPEKNGAPAGRRQPARHPGEAWNVVGTLGAGIAFWGLVGWGIGRLTGLERVFLPLGFVLGAALAVYLVIYQATRR
ncbi:MAG: AtpZ/AtpI family protein [Frankia sp.]|nr:AtpZ/AtpI family protein [Frankia sp.]